MPSTPTRPLVLLALCLLIAGSASAQGEPEPIAGDGRLAVYVRSVPEGGRDKDREDSVKDLIDALKKVSWAALVDTPAEADLDIAIMGRGARNQPGSMPPPMPIPRPGSVGQPMIGNRSELAVYATVRLATDPAGLHTYDLVGTSAGYRWRQCAEDLVDQLEGWTAEGPPPR